MNIFLVLIGLISAQAAFATNEVYKVELKLNAAADATCFDHYFEGKFTIYQYDPQHANFNSEDGMRQRIFNGDVRNGWTAASFEMDMNNNTSSTEVVQLTGNNYSASRKVYKQDRTVILDLKCEGSVVWLP
jgi:hypothetical protein